MRWRLVGYAALGIVSISAPVWGPALLRPLKYFGVRRVEVAGARYSDPEALVRGLGLRPEANLFDDLDALAARLKAMGGLAEVEVGRRLPGTLLVRVREVEPVALAVGPAGLVPVGRDGRPLPFEVSRLPVDAPVVATAEPRLLDVLATIQATDLELYAAIATAQLWGREAVLEVNEGRLLLPTPVEPRVVRWVVAVRRDLAARSLAWQELDGRFRGWVVVRRLLPPSRGGKAA